MVKKTNQTLEALPNIGKGMAAKLSKIGIKTPQAFLREDPYKVFHHLRVRLEPRLCTCALACLVGAHKGVPWHKVCRKTKEEYYKRYPKERLL